ncbi:MAG: hypothetical protein ACM3S5_03920 [Rhodospirillales bacterium]
MSGAQEYGFEKSLLLVCLLLLAQWTGFAVVLCVSGPDHVRTEVFDARGTSPLPLETEAIFNADGRCIGCTDMPVQTAYGWDTCRRQSGGDVLAMLPVGSPNGLVCPAASEAAFDEGRSLLTSSRFVAPVPLRC